MRDGRMFSESANEAETAITLAVLNAVHENDKVTQRSLAQEVGVALGLANAFLKRCVKKGLVKVKQAPANRYLYYLTLKGFAEKGRLTAEYLNHSLNVFRRARAEYTQALATCQAEAWYRVALIGVSDLAEVAMLSAIGTKVELLAVVDRSHHSDKFAGLPVVSDLSALDRVDAVILSGMNGAQDVYEALAGRMDEERILIPELLRVVRGVRTLPDSDAELEPEE
jgi:DNA-binding MarR family transcriptional regulator